MDKLIAILAETSGENFLKIMKSFSVRAQSQIELLREKLDETKKAFKVRGKGRKVRRKGRKVLRKRRRLRCEGKEVKERKSF